ncbi:MAG: hypothetical protein MK025_03510 [Acidobacteriia bacterium]|nr:hypothetical protein [Terriglobia bacterium]
MGKSVKEFSEFFKQLGAADVSHSNNTYLAHAVGVYRDLKSWSCTEEVCDAGMFHSVYGTELFQKFTLPLERRDEVRALIGERAESLAYINCALLRTSLDHSVEQNATSYLIKDRFKEQEVELSLEDFNDLCTIHLCDWLEQIVRGDNWDRRREAFKLMAGRLGGIAEESYNRVYAQEPAKKIENN